MPETKSLLIVLPGVMALKARITVIVLVKTVERARANTRANVICCNMQEAVFGWPMKRNGHRKQRRREMSRMKLRVRLLALTMGESWCLRKIPKTTTVLTDKHRAVQARAIPRESSKDRNVTDFCRQLFLSGFGNS